MPEKFENTLSEEDQKELASYLDQADVDLPDFSDKEKKNIADELDKSRESTRSWLARALMWILAVTVAFSILLSILIIFFSPNESPEQRKEIYIYSKDILALFLSTQTTLIGTVLGFYFGSMQKNS